MGGGKDAASNTNDSTVILALPTFSKYPEASCLEAISSPTVSKQRIWKLTGNFG